jgi:O-antigen ligase
MHQTWQLRGQQATGFLLCMAALFFPFSVAIANISLALALISGLISLQLWQGIICLWQQYRSLTLAIFVYLALVFFGVFWSIDKEIGLEIIGHLWLWLLLPLVLMVMDDKWWRNRFLLSLSIALTAHLFFCVLQMFGIADVDTAGSSLYDATGYIGHISFGIVYGVWSGWLIHYGWLQHGWKRFVPWLLACWGLTMVFAAQGRSGYLVATAMLMIVFWKHLISGQSLKRMFAVLAVFAALGIIIIAGPGKERIESTISGLQAAQHGDMEQVEARWLIWLSAIELWKQQPLTGIGTGGYVKTAKQFKTQNPEHPYFKRIYSHIHNTYLQSLVQWGPVGIIVILMLFMLWIREGVRQPWSTDHASCMALLSGLALVIHGMSSLSLEEHFSTIFAIFMLGTGLASNQSHQHRRKTANGLA